MRVLLDWLERGLIYGGLVGLIALGTVLAQAELTAPSEHPHPAQAAPEVVPPVQGGGEAAPAPEAVVADESTDPPRSAPSATAPTAPPASDGASAGAPEDAITRVRIASIGLDAEVVPAKFENGTWDIPPFRVGHAQYSAGAGAMGNAILFGHVESIRVGRVFQHLDQVQVGDRIVISDAHRDFQYRVVEKRPAPRTDTSILRSTPTASVSLITCAGDWLPLERDYTERLLVRAELER